jgi:hypothetical protein
MMSWSRRKKIEISLLMGIVMMILRIRKLLKIRMDRLNHIIVILSNMEKIGKRMIRV